MTCTLRGDSYKDFNPDKTIEALDNLQEHILDNMDKPELCPECDTPIKVWHEPNGPDDYDVFAECPGCGWCSS